VVEAGVAHTSSGEGGSAASAGGDAQTASDASTDAMRSEMADAGASADAGDPGAQSPGIDGGARGDTDSGALDAAVDGSTDAGTELADAGMVDADWPPGCTVYRLSSPAPIELPADTVHARDIVLPAPWGNAQAQALAFRSRPDSPTLREMSLQTAAGALLALSGQQPVVSPALPSDVGMYLPSGASSLRLRPQYDNRGRAAGQDQSSFEVCVVTGASRRAKTAAFAAVSPAAQDVPAMVEDYELSGRCRLQLSQPVQILAVQPFARKRAVSTRLALESSGGSSSTSVIQQGSYSSADPKLWPLAMPVTLSDGGALISSCTYANASDQSYSFGVGLEDEACSNFVLHVPRGAFSCALED
jgi:hypothetical protein